jgi:hypothetical protein
MAGLPIQQRHVLGCDAVQFDRYDGRFGRIHTSVSYLEVRSTRPFDNVLPDYKTLLYGK